MEKKRIVFIIHKLDIGGAERIIVSLLNNISREKFDIHLIVFQAKGAFMADVKSDVTIHDLKSSSAKAGLFALVKKLYRLSPDRVFSGIGYVNSLLSFFIPFLNLITSKKIVWIARETNVVSIINKKEKFTAMIDWLYRNTYKNFDLIVCQSSYMRDDLLNNYHMPTEKMVIINNPVDIEKIERLSREPLSYTFNKEKINLLAVGALRTQKRFDLLLETVSQLDEQYHLTIVGGGVEEERLKALSKALNLESKVSFEGHQTNPYTYMRHADFMVLSSEYEGFPNVLLEANSLGLPIVAFACPGGTAEIIEKGLNGYLVPCQDIEALTKTIQSFSRDNFDSETIKLHTTQNYNLDYIIQKYEKVLW